MTSPVSFPIQLRLATAMSCGYKTKSGVVGMDAEAKVSYENIAETAKNNNWKVGIISTVSLDHATPAAFDAHVKSRQQMYEISLQLANSGFNYFAGGQLLEPTDKKDPNKPNAIELAKKNGYTVAMGRAGFETLKPGASKVIAMNATVDKACGHVLHPRPEERPATNVTLGEYVEKGDRTTR